MLSPAVRPPSYRIRLFLSVDLAGSTAFKAGSGGDPISENSSQATWVQVTRKFYLNFPALVRIDYLKMLASNDEEVVLKEKYPKPWKTLGDEILFCVRVERLTHLSICVEAFLKTLRTYGDTLEGDEYPLDVKGAGWIAAFPTPNVTVDLGSAKITADQFDEEFEARADREPHAVDFLGSSIDCGFRVATKSSTDRFAVSAELAWLLAEASVRNIFTKEFIYDDRYILKGVLKDRPYPVVFIRTERKLMRQQLWDFERQVSNKIKIEPNKLVTFLGHFMEVEQIDLPHLPGGPRPIPTVPPQKYEEFKRKWLADAADAERQDAAASDSERSENSGGSELPDILVESAKETINKVSSGSASID